MYFVLQRLHIHSQTFRLDAGDATTWSEANVRTLYCDRQVKATATVERAGGTNREYRKLLQENDSL